MQKMQKADEQNGIKTMPEPNIKIVEENNCEEKKWLISAQNEKIGLKSNKIHENANIKGAKREILKQKVGKKFRKQCKTLILSIFTVLISISG